MDWEWEWWERILCLFTVYGELRIVAEQEEYEVVNPSFSQSSGPTSLEKYDQIFQRLQAEWKYIGTLLIGIAALVCFVLKFTQSLTHILQY